MDNLKILGEVLSRSQEDPWCRECLEQIQKYEADFLAIRSKLTEAEQDQLDLYIGACEAWCESHMFVAFTLGRHHIGFYKSLLR